MVVEKGIYQRLYLAGALFAGGGLFFLFFSVSLGIKWANFSKYNMGETYINIFIIIGAILFAAGTLLTVLTIFKSLLAEFGNHKEDINK